MAVIRTARAENHGTWLGGCGGGCCNSKRAVRKAKRAIKQREKRGWKKMDSE